MVAIADKMRVLQDWRKQAETAAHSSNIYNWLLSSGSLPRQFSVKMIDPWPGNIEIGRSLCKGLFTSGGASIPFAQNLWDEIDQYPQWSNQLHGFTWLRDLRALGGDQSRRLARQMVDQWLAHNDRWDAGIWKADILGQRITMWLSTYDFFCGSADERFQERYIGSLMRQTKHLSRVFPEGLEGLPLLRAAKGLIFAGLAFPGREQWAIQGFDSVLAALPKLILKDGGHASRSPQQLVETLQIMLDLRCALYRSNYPVPEILQKTIERAGQALKFFRYGDKRLALFHGGQEFDAAVLDTMQAQIISTGKPEATLRESGFERAVLGRSLLMLDTGTIPEAPYNRSHHSAPLAFEFSHGRDRIFTNCGGHPSNADWQQVLRHTAAHNALTINGRPVHDFHEDGSIIRHHAPIECTRVDTKETCLLDATHDGYGRAGVTHRRRFYLSTQGHDLRGEETLTTKKLPGKPRQIDVRFHLHPSALVTLNKEKNEAVIQLPGGTSWRFYGVGGDLKLESSIHFASGIRPAKTHQLVLCAAMAEVVLQLKWALQRI
jgi:uncharacterized heparinase superfamily protein